MEFVLVGNFKQPRGDLERLIRKLGGKVSAEIHNNAAAIISTPYEVQKMGNQMAEAKQLSIQVVSEDFLAEIQTPGVDPILYIISASICDWGGDVSCCDIVNKNTYISAYTNGNHSAKWS